MKEREAEEKMKKAVEIRRLSGITLGRHVLAGDHTFSCSSGFDPFC